MEETISLISNYGTSAIIVGLFVWDWISNKKKISETLKQNEKCIQEISTQSTNTAKSLELLQKSMDNQDEFLKLHDKRCIAIEEKMKEIILKMEEKIK